MDELLDIVNDEDIVTGQALRSIVHTLGLQHRGVHVFLFTQDSRLLIQKRTRDREAFPSAWDCSVSEHVKAGESYLDSAKRGLREELGLAEVDLHPLVTFRMNYGPNDNKISTLYSGIVEPHNVHFDPIEIEEVDYVSGKQLLEMRRVGKETFCKWFTQMIRYSLGEDSELQILDIHSTNGFFEYPI